MKKCRKSLEYDWTSIPLQVVANIVSFEGCAIAVNDKFDYLKLFGKRSTSIWQLFSTVSFGDNIPFWSLSENITTIKTSVTNSKHTFDWLDNWRYLKRICIDISHLYGANNSINAEVEDQIESMIKKLEASTVVDLELVFNYLARADIEEHLERLTSLKSLSLKMGLGRENSNNYYHDLFEAIYKLQRLIYLSVYAIEFSPNGIVLPLSIKILELGIQYRINEEELTNVTPLISLESFTIRQLHESDDFPMTAVRLIKALTYHESKLLKNLHVHFKKLSTSIKKLVSRDVLPIHVIVLSIHNSGGECDFKGLNKCANQLETLYISGYLDVLHTLDTLNNQASLRTLGIGYTTVLTQKLSRKLLKLPSLINVWIGNGFLDAKGLAVLKGKINVFLM
jgi:hypothetical protein